VVPGISDLNPGFLIQGSENSYIEFIVSVLPVHRWIKLSFRDRIRTILKGTMSELKTYPHCKDKSAEAAQKLGSIADISNGDIFFLSW